MVAKFIFLSIILSTFGISISGSYSMRDGYTINRPMIVKVMGRIDGFALEKFATNMEEARATGQSVIPIVISSNGGEVRAMFGMIDIIESMKVPVATIAIGKAMSAAAALLTCGDEGMRFAYPNTTIMVHEPSTVSAGKTGEVVADADEIKRLNVRMLELMSENIGKDKDYFKNLIHSKGHADIYLTADEAKEHGIVNEVRIPKLETAVIIKTFLK